MSRAVRLPVRGYALWTLTAYEAERWTDEDRDGVQIEATCDALRAGGRCALLVTGDNVRDVIGGLRLLANSQHHEVAREERLPRERRDEIRVRALRGASRGLSRLADRLAAGLGRPGGLR